MELNYSREDELLLFCARCNLNSDSIDYIRSLINEGLDWDYLIQMADRHSLKPLLYSNLVKICKTDPPIFINDFIINDLAEFFGDNAQRNLFLWSELIRILKVFKTHGINAVSYKGPVLSILAYENLALRQFSDLDILISPEQVPLAKKLLISNGFVPEIDLNEIQQNQFIKSQQEYKFSGKSFEVDLHWKLTLLNFKSSDYDLADQENMVTFEIQGCKIKTLNPEVMFIHLCIHNSSHRWPILSQLCDLSELIKKQNLNWIKIKKMAEIMGIKRIVCINLFLAQKLLDIQLPQEINEEIIMDPLVEKIGFRVAEKFFNDSSSGLKLIEELKMNLTLRDNVYLGIQDVIRGIFIPTAYEWKNIKLPGRFSFVYYLIRPFLLLTRYRIN